MRSQQVEQRVAVRKAVQAGDAVQRLAFGQAVRLPVIDHLQAVLDHPKSPVRVRQGRRVGSGDAARLRERRGVGVEQGYDLAKIPYVVQYNKRDLPNAASLAELRASLNTMGVPDFEAVAPTGVGVFETLKQVARLVLTELRKSS